MKYLGYDHFYTEYDRDLASVMCRVAFKILPSHILREGMHFSFDLPERHVYANNKLLCHTFDGIYRDNRRNELWVCIEDEEITEAIFKSTIPVFADRCLLKAKNVAKERLMKQIISDEMAGSGLNFLLPDTKWDKLLKNE